MKRNIYVLLLALSLFTLTSCNDDDPDDLLTTETAHWNSPNTGGDNSSGFSVRCVKD